ncbi:MAG: hypothetical protein ACREOJ_05200, partial [Gemmatimonadaceae bacterium]
MASVRAAPRATDDCPQSRALNGVAAMAENKTNATEASAERYIAAIQDEDRRTYCAALSKLMARACLYIRKLDDVDLEILETLIVASVSQRKRNHAWRDRPVSG